MKRFEFDSLQAIAVLIILSVAALLSMLALGCTPQSTVPFDPSRKQSSEELALQQLKAAMPENTKDPYSGMDCVKYLEYQIAYCEATYACSWRQYSQYRRELRLMNKTYRSQCLYSKDHIQEVFRVMRPRGRNPMGN